MTSHTRVWFITGCSTGFGRELARAALMRGDRVVATARNLDTLSEFQREGGVRALIHRLDVTDAVQVQEAVQAAIRAFGRIDVLVNNAGYGILGAVEEVSDAEVRQVFETNVFGLLAVTRAVLPHMRKQRSGHIINMSSQGGHVGIIGLGIYSATKFAVEGLSEALAKEVESFGIKVTLVEPGPFRTDFAGRSLKVSAPIADYAEPMDKRRNDFPKRHGNQPGDPARAAQILLRLVDNPTPPLRVPLGESALTNIWAKLNSVAKDLEAGEAAAMEADFK